MGIDVEPQVVIRLEDRRQPPAPAAQFDDVTRVAPTVNLSHVGQLVEPGGLYDRLARLVAARFSHAEVRDLLERYSTGPQADGVTEIAELSESARDEMLVWLQEIGPRLEYRTKAAMREEDARVAAAAR